MKCSVIITSKNRPELAEEAINSVLNQTNKADEIIFINDNSNINYANIESRYKKEIIYVKTDSDLGGGRARNLGAFMAKHDVLMFLDDDDLWTKNKIETQLAFLNRHQESKIIFTGRKIVNISNRRNIIRETNHKTFYNNQDILIFKSNFIGVTSGVAITKNFFNSIGKFDETLPCRQDYDLWIRACINGGNALWDHTHSVIYTVHGTQGNQISNKGHLQEEALAILLRKYKKEIQSLSKGNLNSCMGEKYFSVAKAYRNESFFKRFRFAFLSFLKKPRLKTFLLAIAPKKLLQWIGL